jgi:tetratricopeptide (TPR) repeat protein
VYVILRRPDEAIPLLETALRQRPGLAEAQKALGQAWMGKQDFARALPLLQAVAASEPEDDQIHFLLAQVWRGLDKAEEAAKEMQLHQQILRRLADAKVSSPEP